MTPQEALKFLDEHCTASVIPFEVKVLCSNALEKEIPKKPINNGVKKCPNCGFVPFDTCTTITSDCEVTHIIHCEWCGQAIDYGE